MLRKLVNKQILDFYPLYPRFIGDAKTMHRYQKMRKGPNRQFCLEIHLQLQMSPKTTEELITVLQPTLLVRELGEMLMLKVHFT